MAIWAWKSYPTTPFSIWPFKQYWNHQVFRSFTTNRGDLSHATHGNKWLYVSVILKYGWPWWWTVPAAIYFWKKKKIRKNKNLIESNLGPWIVISLINFFSFVLPFSMSEFQLPHYIHPTYLALFPIGAYFIIEITPSKVLKFFEHLYVRWSILALLVLIFAWTSKKTISSTQNRGQEFVQSQQQMNKLPQHCHIWVPQSEIDPYRMESYALWYFPNRNWIRVPDEKFVKNHNNAIKWSPKNLLIDSSFCKL
jgi:hypothetical protein